MRFALNLPPFGPFADVRKLVDLAVRAEEAGWDGFFLWDHMAAEPAQPIADPWVALGAIAVRTSRIRIGTMVTPLPRRRPWKLARETATLDRLSAGRLILGVGLGFVEMEFGAFGDETDPRVRGDMLDEGLEVLTGLWSGDPFSYDGQHYQVTKATFLPAPLQQPRIPIWVAGMWPNKRPLRRAARWDGVFPIDPNPSQRRLSPDDFRDVLAYVGRHRASTAPFEVSHGAITSGNDRAADADLVKSYAHAGVTWWHEGIYPGREDRIQLGPPVLA